MVKIFAHRGFVTKNAKENSIESLRAAYDNKFIGVEFDVWFLNNELVVHHDMPKENKNLVKFSDYLQFKNEFEYWIDFKNLDEDNIDKALQIAKKELFAAEIDLKKVYFAPFITNLQKALPIYNKIYKAIEGAQIMAVCEEIKRDDLVFYHQELQKNNIKYLSINHENIDENFIEIFSDINIFAWTVNDLEYLRELEKLGIKNITSDIIKL